MNQQTGGGGTDSRLRVEAITCSCRKPDVFRSDYTADGIRFTNRHCNGCGNHWHGPVGQVTAYTARQWDALLDAALEAERAETRMRQSDITDVRPLDLEGAREAVADVIAEERGSEVRL
jgi:hypothetical protein